MRVIKLDYMQPFHDILNDNIDLQFTLDDDRVFAATVFTLDNVKKLMSRYETTGECQSGVYFWASGLIIVKQLDRISIETAIRGVIEDEGTVAPFTELFVG